MPLALDFVRDVLSGKTLGRVLLNRLVARHCRDLEGVVIDLASGVRPSYLKYLPPRARVVRTDRAAGPGILAADLDRPLPFEDASAAAVLFMNALYIVEDPAATLREIARVLKKDGRLFLASPFLAAEMPEPHDFKRFTREGLERLLAGAGFSPPTIVPYGERFAAAANLLHPFFLFGLVRLFVYPLALLLDAATPRRLRRLHPAPLGYFCVARKP